jgi:hypothetical protein
MVSTKRARDNRRQPWSGAPDCPVHHRTVSGAPPDRVRCTTGQCPVHHRTVSGAPPDSVRCTRGLQAKLRTFGNFQRRFAIIHRTCPVHTGLSGEPAEQRLLRANGHLQQQLMRARAHRSQTRGKWHTGHSTVHVRCATGHPGGPSSQSSNGRNPTT